MSDYLSPRRFARLFEMDRNGPPACGTLEDQGHVRDAISAWVVFDEGFDRALYALDKDINRSGRSYLWFSFLYENQPPSLGGRTYRTVIQLFPNTDEPFTPRRWEYVVIHEIGHLIGWWLLEPADRSENWATDFQQWVFQGAESSGHVYEALDAVGAQDSVRG